MDYHNWRCEQCDRVLSQIGLTSLTFAVRLHDREEHGRVAERTIEEIMISSQYFKSAYAYNYAGIGVPTMDEYKWLRHQAVLWDGDNRTPGELAQRYRNKSGTVL